MPSELVAIRTHDGTCATRVCTPNGRGPWPAVMLYMDAGGIRPAVEMAQRVADGGYTVLLPDLYYRYGPYGPFVPRDVFAGDVRAILGPLMATTSTLLAAHDTAALLAHLDTRADVAGTNVGCVGFCMGGGMAIVAAGAYPERVKAVASFHGGDLATDEPTSPHLAAARLRASVSIAAAARDDHYPPAMAERFERSLAAHGVAFEAQTYEAAHGWMVPDFPTFDPARAEDGWRRLFAFFGATLGG